MYLPRGWLHQALTSGSDSLHITVGVNVRRWIDEARAELDAQEQQLAFRETIDGDEPPELPALDAHAVRRRARERFVRSRRPILDGQLSELRALDELTVETELERRDTVIADLHGTRLVFEGREHQLPGAPRRRARVPAHDGGAVPCDRPARLAGRGRAARPAQEARARRLSAT